MGDNSKQTPEMIEVGWETVKKYWETVKKPGRCKEVLGDGRARDRGST